MSLFPHLIVRAVKARDGYAHLHAPIVETQAGTAVRIAVAHGVGRIALPSTRERDNRAASQSSSVECTST